MRIFSLAFMFLVPFSLLAEEECIFDQKEQEQTYLELQKKYPGSRYIENEHRLLIPENGQQIALRRGGCVHFGITIEVQAPRNNQFENEDLLFSRIRELVTKYGQELVDPEKLETIINEKRWVNVEVEEGSYYLLAYEELTAFEVYRMHDREHTTIGAMFYY